MSRIAKRVLVIVVLAVFLVSIVIAIGRSSRVTADQLKNQLSQKVKQSPDMAINFNNFEGVPLSIEKAVTKEISVAEYQKLTGGDVSGASRFAAFPSVTLLNTTNQRVTRLIVTVGNRQTKKWFVVSFRQANIAPQQTFSMTAADWSHDKVSEVEVDSKTTTVPPKVTDFDAARLWWPGGARASDLVFRLALVEFEDGKKWEVDDARGSLY